MFAPKYSISDEILNHISKIENLTTILSQAHIPAEVLEHIRKQCLIALTHFSTQIEGNRLSMEEVSGVIEQNKTYGLKRDEKEVSNYFKLLEKAPALIKKYQGKIKEEIILLCHKNIQKGIAQDNLLGKFRDVQNAIYEAGTNRLVYLPPEPNDVPTLMGDLCNWVNSTNIHPLILAAIFHNQFVTIHPFVDGNGRTARILSLYLLDSHGYQWHDIVPIDRYYADNRSLYYSALQLDYSHNYYEGRANTNFSKWIEYYVDGIKTILEGINWIIGSHIIPRDATQKFERRRWRRGFVGGEPAFGGVFSFVGY